MIRVRAPFIHSFIVDEWDPAKPGEPEGVRLTVRERSTFPTLSAENAERMGHTPSRENLG